jgi:hypothetical protein
MLHSVQDAFPNDISGAALGPIFSGHQLDHWRWDPQWLPKHRWEMHLAHCANSPKPVVICLTYDHWKWDTQWLLKHHCEKSVFIAWWKCNIKMKCNKQLMLVTVNCVRSTSQWRWKERMMMAAWTVWCMLLLWFEDLIAHYLETRNFSWDSAHILCSARRSLIPLVFSQSANRQN